MAFGLVALLGVLLALDASPDLGQNGYLAEIGSEKYATMAAWDGFGAHQPMSALSSHYGLHLPAAPVAHPRPPAALVIQTPLLKIEDDTLVHFVGVLGAISTAFVCWVAARLSKLPAWILALIAAVFIATSNPSVGNMGGLVGPLLAGSWLTLRRNPALSGALLGLGAAIKLWPLLIVAGLLLHRSFRRTVMFAVLAFAGSTAIGLLLPGVDIGELIKAMHETSAYFQAAESNVGLPAWFARLGLPSLGGFVVAIALWGMTLRLGEGDVDLTFALSMVFALLASPVSWAGYWRSAVPVAAFLVSRLLAPTSMGAALMDGSVGPLSLPWSRESDGSR